MSGLDTGPRIVILTLVLLCSPHLLMAQDRLLDQVERFASTGRAEEARAMLLEWWENDRPVAGRQDLQFGLWLRGRLTVDPGQAARDFRSLVIEYPGGRYTAQALFRLAQGSLATGDGERARTYLASLTRDYPGSPVGENAEAWMARAEAAGPAPVLRRVEVEDAQDDDAASTGPPIAEAIEVPEPAAPPAAEDPRSQPPSDDGPYAVQLGAFLDEARAETLRARAQDAGLDVRLVHVEGSRLLHVRVGRFDSSAEASVFFRSVRDVGFAPVVVRDAQNEDRVRG
jgi:cell division septation protein DedD